MMVANLMAEPTGLEPATSDVTGRRSNQLNYVPAIARGSSKNSTGNAAKANFQRNFIGAAVL